MQLKREYSEFKVLGNTCGFR